MVFRKFIHISLLSISLFLIGCTASLRPLMIGQPSSKISLPAVSKQKVPVPILIDVRVSENMPTRGGKYTYPLKHFLEKAFQDVLYTLFIERGTTGGYFYSVEINVPSSSLRTSGSNASIEIEINSVLRSPKDKVLEMRTFSGSASSNFDNKGLQVPEAVWSVCYQAANEFLNSIRNSKWIRSAMTEVAERSAAQGLETIAVLTFEETTPAAKKSELGQGIARMITTSLARTGRFKVVERERINKVMEEHKFARSGVTDSETVKQIGKMLNVDLIVFGTVFKTGDSNAIDAQLVDIESGEIVVADRVQGSREEEIPDMVDRLIEKIVAMR